MNWRDLNSGLFIFVGLLLMMGSVALQKPLDAFVCGGVVLVFSVTVIVSDRRRRDLEE